jgi:hypothetical protein
MFRTRWTDVFRQLSGDEEEILWMTHYYCVSYKCFSFAQDLTDKTEVCRKYTGFV